MYMGQMGRVSEATYGSNTVRLQKSMGRRTSCVSGSSVIDSFSPCSEATRFKIP